MNAKLITRSSIVLLTIGCIQVACVCGGPGEPDYKIISYKLNAIRGSIYPGDSRLYFYDRPDAQLSSGDSIAFDSLGFSFQPEVMHLSMLSGSMMSSAYACEPAPGMPTQSIHRIRISSDQQFITEEGTYEPGTILNEHFDVNNGEFESIQSMLSNRNLAYRGGFILTLSSGVSTTQRHTFSFQVILSDSSKFEMESLPVIIRPE